MKVKLFLPPQMRSIGLRILPVQMIEVLECWDRTERDIDISKTSLFQTFQTFNRFAPFQSFESFNETVRSRGQGLRGKRLRLSVLKNMGH